MKLINDDCLKALKDLPDNSVDTVITDPPYLLKFMGKKWDDTDDPIKFHENWGKEAYRILKPGGYALVFGGTRTFHYVALGLEQSGFFLKNTISYMFSSGFPKSYNISIGIDKKLGVERDIVGTRVIDVGMQGGKMHAGRKSEFKEVPLTAPKSQKAKEFVGYSIDLKPAYELILLFLKEPEGTYAENAIKYGLAGLNIDGCRLAYEDAEVSFDRQHRQQTSMSDRGWTGNVAKVGTSIQVYKEGGRWPANVVFSHTDRCRLVGKKKVAGRQINRFNDGMKPFGNGAGHKYTVHKFPDEYIEVYECSEDCPVKMLEEQNVNAPRFFYCSKPNKREKTVDGRIENTHPTVKPIDFMRWLCRLTRNPYGGVVLDPFMGSGTTGIAATLEERDFIGIEKEKEYFDIAKKRIGFYFSGAPEKEDVEEIIEEQKQTQGELF